MNGLIDVLIYFCKNYPYPNDLSKTRLTKMVYLADWKYALEYGEQITDIEWEFNHYGPYKVDVYETANQAFVIFDIKETTNYFGDKKEIITCSPEAKANLSTQVKKILDFVITTTKDLNWTDFIRLVYSTYPILSKRKYTKLNLVELAGEYQEN